MSAPASPFSSPPGVFRRPAWRDLQPFRLEVAEVSSVSVTLRWSLCPSHYRSVVEAPGARVATTSSQYNKDHLQPAKQQPPSPSTADTKPAKKWRLTRMNRRFNRFDSTNKALAGQANEEISGAAAASTSSGAGPVDELERWPSSESASSSITAVDDAAQELGVDSYPPPPSSPLSEHTKDNAGGSSESRIAQIFESGVSITVNGLPWQHVVLGERGTDEAVIVVYGLLPGREYEMEMKVGNGVEMFEAGRIWTDGNRASLSSQPNSEPARTSDDTLLTTSFDLPGVVSTHLALDLRHAHSSPVSSPPGSMPASPSQSPSALPARLPAPLSLPDRQTALEAELKALDEIKNQLTAQLKKARKAASRAESALRSEIEAIKRSLGRMSGADHRSKQKVLALQESIRQAGAHAEQADEEADEVERERDEWVERENDKQKLFDTVKEELTKSDADAAEVVGTNDKAIAELEHELASLTTKLDKLTSRKDKLDKDVVGGLEKQVSELEKEVDRTLNPPPEEILRNFDHHAQYPHHYLLVDQQQQVRPPVPPLPPAGPGGPRAGAGTMPFQPQPPMPPNANMNAIQAQRSAPPFLPPGGPGAASQTFRPFQPGTALPFRPGGPNGPSGGPGATPIGKPAQLPSVPGGIRPNMPFGGGGSGQDTMTNGFHLFPSNTSSMASSAVATHFGPGAGPGGQLGGPTLTNYDFLSERRHSHPFPLSPETSAALVAPPTRSPRRIPALTGPSTATPSAYNFPFFSSAASASPSAPAPTSASSPRLSVSPHLGASFAFPAVPGPVTAAISSTTPTTAAEAEASLASPSQNVQRAHLSPTSSAHPVLFPLTTESSPNRLSSPSTTAAIADGSSLATSPSSLFSAPSPNSVSTAALALAPTPPVTFASVAARSGTEGVELE